jgi:hypothetical protein
VPTTTETREQRVDRRDDSASIEEKLLWAVRELADLQKRLDVLDEPDEHLDDEVRERIRERLMELPDAELVGMLLAIHKVVEQRTRGSLRGVVERESTVLTTVLDRFAQEATLDALALWNEHSEDGEED